VDIDHHIAFEINIYKFWRGAMVEKTDITQAIAKIGNPARYTDVLNYDLSTASRRARMARKPINKVVQQK
jgi:hypothetical protein